MHSTCVHQQIPQILTFTMMYRNISVQLQERMIIGPCLLTDGVERCHVILRRCASKFLGLQLYGILLKMINGGKVKPEM
jgi:hypothetical protein